MTSPTETSLLPMNRLTILFNGNEISGSTVTCNRPKNPAEMLALYKELVRMSEAPDVEDVEVLGKHSPVIAHTPDAATKELLEDKARLDWLDSNRTAHIFNHFKYHQSNAAEQKTWRTAIDNARKHL